MFETSFALPVSSEPIVASDEQYANMFLKSVTLRVSQLGVTMMPDWKNAELIMVTELVLNAGTVLRAVHRMNIEFISRRLLPKE